MVTDFCVVLKFKDCVCERERWGSYINFIIFFMDYVQYTSAICLYSYFYQVLKD